MRLTPQTLSSSKVTVIRRTASNTSEGTLTEHINAKAEQTNDKRVLVSEIQLSGTQRGRPISI